jgi:MAE_28990/MAE_18760-like HEPN
MNIADLRAELEAERAWREDEIRKLQNLGESILDTDDKDQYRRALVLMLYAHFEGFCKFTLSLYSSAINAAQIQCEQADVALAAASLADVFRDLRNPEKKSDIFRHSMPDDRKLHAFAKEREFVQRSTEFLRRTVEIPDGAVDMESNLTPTVLSKNLFRLGFSHDAFEAYNADINKLLEFRNKIGHGEMRVGVVKKSYDDIRVSVDRVMTGITMVVMRALEQREYLREETLY